MNSPMTLTTAENSSKWWEDDFMDQGQASPPRIDTPTADRFEWVVWDFLSLRVGGWVGGFGCLGVRCLCLCVMCACLSGCVSECVFVYRSVKIGDGEWMQICRCGWVH